MARGPRGRTPRPRARGALGLRRSARSPRAPACFFFAPWILPRVHLAGRRRSRGRSPISICSVGASVHRWLPLANALIPFALTALAFGSKRAAPGRRRASRPARRPTSRRSPRSASTAARSVACSLIVWCASTRSPAPGSRARTWQRVGPDERCQKAKRSSCLRVIGLASGRSRRRRCRARAAAPRASRRGRSRPTTRSSVPKGKRASLASTRSARRRLGRGAERRALSTGERGRTRLSAALAAVALLVVPFVVWVVLPAPPRIPIPQIRCAATFEPRTGRSPRPQPSPATPPSRVRRDREARPRTAVPSAAACWTRTARRSARVRGRCVDKDVHTRERARRLVRAARRGGRAARRRRARAGLRQRRTRVKLAGGRRARQHAAAPRRRPHRGRRRRRGRRAGHQVHARGREVHRRRAATTRARTAAPAPNRGREGAASRWRT